MAQVTGKVLKPFTYKKESYDIDDEIKMDAVHAAQYEKLDYVKFNREASTKVEAAVEKLKEPKTK
jgi:hypothetical protein